MTAMVLLSEWMSSQVEFWRKTEYEGYDVSSFGRARSWRIVKRLPAGYGSREERRKEPKILKLFVNKDGYAVLRTGSAKARISGTIHRIIAKTFIPNPNELPCVNHLTGYKGDNRIDGLVWATKAENVQHAWTYGLHKRDRIKWREQMTAARRKNGIPEVLVRMIRNMISDGVSQGQIRRWSGLKPHVIQCIAVRRTFRDIV